MEVSEKEPVVSKNNAPIGRYLLRDDGVYASAHEVEILEWSDAGRLKVRVLSGNTFWIEPSRYGPKIVERLS